MPVEHLINSPHVRLKIKTSLNSLNVNCLRKYKLFLWITVGYEEDIWEIDVRFYWKSFFSSEIFGCYRAYFVLHPRKWAKIQTLGIQLLFIVQNVATVIMLERELKTNIWNNSFLLSEQIAPFIDENILSNIQNTSNNVTNRLTMAS